MKVEHDAHQKALIAAAGLRGVTFEDLVPTWGVDSVIYRHGERSALVGKGRIFPWMSTESEFICDHKHVCKQVLASLGLPVPDGVHFDDPFDSESAAEIEALLAKHGALVGKPADASHGDGVQIGLRSLQQIHAWWREHHGHFESFILEEVAAGADLRLQVVGGRLVAACVREPASVVGDGQRSVKALMEERQATIAAINPNNRLELDEITLGLLTEQGLSRDSVPDIGRKVRLKHVNNLGVGGHAVDVSDRLHPRWGEWGTRISRRLGMRAMALDAMTPDASLDPLGNGKLLEINARAEWLHHMHSDRCQHDIAGLLLDDLLGLG